ncbi:serine/threonine-protein kinase [Sporobolomyces koalae]|uniref:serine/threonine-protein kinase n=1 Tax=Sporobolomyces koalae TaxID=500713 RepID=UPI00317D38BF
MSAQDTQLCAPSLPDFKLAEKLGQGAFGSALNWSTGETCAIKQIDLSHILAAELPDIMQEIDLLKNLHHSNIVQYRGYARTDSALYIVLEYCENGSLAAIVKKFGRFPESLVGLYTLQVLQGLLYLHDQGVIHRDIKGSNILATKEGNIKLADFGVATRAGGPSNSAVVGSPYWMAPEVVDQSGATTASDIWSLGALVIELLTGKPPYHFLDPMPALFRIVNDDGPPLPEGASAAVRDFLSQCFQKDGNLRISAKKLLRHPWMIAAKKQQETQSLDRHKSQALGRRGGSATGGRQNGPRPISMYDDTVQRVQQWNEALKMAPTVKEVAKTFRPSLASLANENALALSRSKPGIPQARSKPFTASDNSAVPLDSTQADQLVFVTNPNEDSEHDNWDSDFEGGLSITKIDALDRDLSSRSQAVREEGDKDEYDSTRSLTIRPTPRKGLAAGKTGLPTVLEDPTDRSREEASTSVKNGTEQPDLVPETMLTNAIDTTTGQRPALSLQASMAKFSESSEADDYSDVFGKCSSPSDQETFGSLRLQVQSSIKSELEDEDSDEDDPFATVADPTPIYDTDDTNLEASLLRDQAARQCTLASDLLDLVGGRDPDNREAREAALQLTVLLEDSEDARKHFAKRHGMLIVVEALQVARSRDMLAILLRIANLIVGSDAAELEKLALVGGCPVIVSFASKRHCREIRLEAALFIGSMCRTSLLTLQMFVACRGLRTLVDMLDESYDDGKDFIWLAVDGIARVFEMNGPIPRNDFCRLLAQEGLLEPLSCALTSVCGDPDDLAESAKAKIVDILLLFAQSDFKVKEALATRANALRFVKATRLLEPDLLATLLKTIKNLSMLPHALDVLQNANAIEALVEILGRDCRGRLGAEIQNHALHTLFNLCRLSKTRQEEAVSYGAIPVLQKIVMDNSPLKQFALPILCDLAHLASRATRKTLWQHDGVTFYLYLLSTDSYWINAALEAILAWLQAEPARVEGCLLESTAISSLVEVFCKTKGAGFDNMLEPFLKILRTSPVLAARVATEPEFCKRIAERIERSTTKAVVRLNLLRTIKAISDAVTDQRQRGKVIMIMKPSIDRCAEQEKTVLAGQLAKSLSTEFASMRVATPKTWSSRRTGSQASSRTVTESLTSASAPVVRRSSLQSRSLESKRRSRILLDPARQDESGV